MSDSYKLDQPIEPTFDFPVTDVKYIKGAHQTVSSFSELVDFPMSRRTNGMLFWVDNEKIFYTWNASQGIFQKMRSVLGIIAEGDIENGDVLVFRDNTWRPENLSSRVFDATRDEIITLISNEELETGAYYNISDYQYKQTIPYSPEEQTGNIEVLRTQGLSGDALNPNVISLQHPLDAITYNIELEEFGSMGKILHRKDPDRELETYYDFRAAKFYRKATATGLNVFTKNTVSYSFQVPFPFYMESLNYRGNLIQFDTSFEINSPETLFAAFRLALNGYKEEIFIHYENTTIYLDTEFPDNLGPVRVQVPFNDERRSVRIDKTLIPTRRLFPTFNQNSYASKIGRNHNTNQGFRDNNVMLFNSFLVETKNNNRNITIINSNNIEIDNDARDLIILDCNNLKIGKGCAYSTFIRTHDSNIGSHNKNLYMANSISIETESHCDNAHLFTCSNIKLLKETANVVISNSTDNKFKTFNSFISNAANSEIANLNNLNLSGVFDVKANEAESNLSIRINLPDYIKPYNQTSILNLKSLNNYSRFIHDGDASFTIERIDYFYDRLVLEFNGSSNITLVSGSLNRTGDIKISGGDLLEVAADNYTRIIFERLNGFFVPVDIKEL